MDDRDWAKFWLAVIGMVITAVIVFGAMYYHHVRQMSANGFCETLSNQPNTVAQWSWQKCTTR